MKALKWIIAALATVTLVSYVRKRRWDAYGRRVQADIDRMERDEITAALRGDL